MNIELQHNQISPSVCCFHFDLSCNPTVTNSQTNFDNEHSSRGRLRSQSAYGFRSRYSNTYAERHWECLSPAFFQFTVFRTPSLLMLLLDFN